MRILKISLLLSIVFLVLSGCMLHSEESKSLYMGEDSVINQAKDVEDIVEERAKEYSKNNDEY